MSGQQADELHRRCRSDTHEVAPNILKNRYGMQKMDSAGTRPGESIPVSILIYKPDSAGCQSVFPVFLRVFRLDGLEPINNVPTPIDRRAGPLVTLWFGRQKNSAAGSPLSSQLDPPRRGPTPLPKGADPQETYYVPRGSQIGGRSGRRRCRYSVANVAWQRRVWQDCHTENRGSVADKQRDGGHCAVGTSFISSCFRG